MLAATGKPSLWEPRALPTRQPDGSVIRPDRRVWLLVLPLAPHRPLWGEVLDPQVVARLVLVLLLIQSLAHLGRRLLAARHALALSSLASGFVSSTATIASLGMAVREGQESARVQGGAAAMSCVATMLQMLAVAATVQPQWLPLLAAPALAGGVAAALWCAAFALQSVRMLPVFWRPRADGAGGCDGLLPPRPAPALAPRQSTCAPEALTTDS